MNFQHSIPMQYNKTPVIIVMCFFLGVTGSVCAQGNWNELFSKCGVTGITVVYDHNNGVWSTNDIEGLERKSLPASTFKILNTLIVLNEGAVNSLQDTIPWPGNIDTVKYGYRPSIFKDITVAEAFQKSAGWAYREMAKEVGRDRYLTILDSCGYGNGIIWNEDPDFWNFGQFGVSPREQIELLTGVYEETLPFKKEAFSGLKKIMVVEETENYVLRAKTGWTRYNDINLGWWIGYIEKGGAVYFFATRIQGDRENSKSKDFSRCRKEITYSAFRTLGVLK